MIRMVERTIKSCGGCGSGNIVQVDACRDCGGTNILVEKQEVPWWYGKEVPGYTISKKVEIGGETHRIIPEWYADVKAWLEKISLEKAKNAFIALGYKMVSAEEYDKYPGWPWEARDDGLGQ